MNSSLDSIYLVVNFKSSIEEYYQANTVDNFRVRLNKPLILQGGFWKVALCEIHVANLLLDAGDVKKENIYLQIEFESCEGLLVHGYPTHALRFIPYAPNIRAVFSDPFYVPLQTGYIDSCHITVKPVANKPAMIQQLENSLITCTLHFKKTSVPRHI